MRESEFRALVVSLLQTIAADVKRTADSCEQAEARLMGDAPPELPGLVLTSATTEDAPPAGDPAPVKAILSRRKRGKGGQ
jgi:hypothetical protein